MKKQKSHRNSNQPLGEQVGCGFAGPQTKTPATPLATLSGEGVEPLPLVSLTSGFSNIESKIKMTNKTKYISRLVFPEMGIGGTSTEY